MEAFEKFDIDYSFSDEKQKKKFISFHEKNLEDSEKM
jgi:hypothetical protein